MDRDGFRNVLMIAYYFPPMGLSGVQRTAKFAKYLTRYGWKPIVVTIEPMGYYAFDETLLGELEEVGVQIVRTPVRDVSRLFGKKTVVKMPPEWMRKTLQYVGDFFFIPDTKRGWKSIAVKAASAVVKSGNIDIIFATAPPQTDFLIGTELKRRFNIPLVVDYRDAWIEYPFKYFPTPLHRWLHVQLEKKVLRAADRVIVTHRRVKEALLMRYRFLEYNDITILPQGYDPDDISSRTPQKRSTRRKMVLVHAGTFYGGRNPKVFAQALSQALLHYPKMRGRIDVRFLGQTRKEDELLIQQLNLQEVVTFYGYVSHRNCVEQLLNADVLWFVIDNDYQTPGKLYEYFGVRRPILASVVDGYTKELIESSGAAFCVPLNDVSAHEQALVDLFQKFENNRLPRIPTQFAQKFDRSLLTGELAKIFEYLVDYE
ncbi:MAG: glycosyltransferase family 4 protein [Bacteroidetes bacterium]|nr:glycosyltransferase family 4 protein [Bacteroidota bacterium]